MSLTTDLMLKYYEQNKQVIPTEGLVFWASLNGQTPNRAETGQRLTIHGTAPTYTTVDGVPCATGDYRQWGISFPATNLPSGNTDRTLSMWTKTATNVSSQPMFGQAYGVEAIGKAFVLFHGTGVGNNAIRLNLVSYNYTSDYEITKDVWHNIVATKTGRNIAFYDNGVKVRTWYATTTPATSDSYSGGINLYSASNTLYGGCPIASCRIYNRALSDAEIAALANEFHPTTGA